MFFLLFLVLCVRVSQEQKVLKVEAGTAALRDWLFSTDFELYCARYNPAGCLDQGVKDGQPIST